MTKRDKLLGDALLDGGVPEHGAGFFERLSEGLDRVDEELEQGSVLPMNEVRRGRGQRARRQRARRRPIGLAFAAAAVVAGVALTYAFGPLGGLPGGRTLGPEVASAAEVARLVQTALREIGAIRGEIVTVTAQESGSTGTELRWEFWATAAGDFRMRGTNVLGDGTTRDEDVAYSSARGIERIRFADDGYEVVEERIGLAAGPPDPSPSEWALRRSLGMVVRALLDADDAVVTETTYDGRPAWELDTPVRTNPLAPGSPDNLRITVDRETGFPVRIVETLDGALVAETRIEGLEIDPELPADVFEPDLEAQSEVYPVDYGFSRTSLAQAAEVTGYEPLVPAWVPEGFEVDTVTVSESAQATGKEGMNPPSRSVVSIAYRRGFDRVIVSTRLIGDDPGAWSDPLASGEGLLDTPESVRIADGALAGSEAEVLIDPLAVPHLWTRGEGLVVTVSGDVSRDELLRITESFGR